MDKINDIKINLEPTNEDVLDLVLLIERTNQTNQAKYEIIKPVADKLNLYCDKHKIRCVEECNFLTIKIKKIKFVYYNKEKEMFMMQMKNSLNLHILNVKEKTHTIYVYKERHNFIVNYLLKAYNKIWLLYLRCKLYIQFYIFAYKQVYCKKDKSNSDSKL